MKAVRESNKQGVELSLQGLEGRNGATLSMCVWGVCIHVCMGVADVHMHAEASTQCQEFSSIASLPSSVREDLGNLTAG